VAAVRFLGKLVAFAGILAFLVGLMLHFHIATYIYLAWAFAGSLTIYLWSRPSVRSLTEMVLFGAAFAAIYGAVEGGPVLGAMLAFLGLGSLAQMCRGAIWGSAAGRQASLDTCLTACMFPLFLVIAGFSLAVTSEVHPKTYDMYLYAFDEQLGFQPSFLIGRLFARFSGIRQICYFGYEALPLAMAIAFAKERSAARMQPSSIMLAFTVAAAGGFLLYNFYPAVGPVHVFGSQFPLKPPLAGSPPFPLVAAGAAPRNAMPSVHIAMALLILWNSRSWGAVWRWLAGALLVVTGLATLGFGEHYLVDLFVAAPFALLAQAAAAVGVPWRNAARIASGATGAALVTAWLAYLRLPAPPLYGNRAWAWCALLGTALVVWWLERRLHRATFRRVLSKENMLGGHARAA